MIISAKLVNVIPHCLAEEDYRLLETYRMYRMGFEIKPECLRGAAPERETIGKLYRKIKNSDIRICSLEDLTMYFTTVSPAVVLAAVDVLLELSLIKVKYNSMGGFKRVTDPDKKQFKDRRHKVFVGSLRKAMHFDELSKLIEKSDPV